MNITLLLVAAAIGSVNAAVIGIDFGARYVKIGVIRPGAGIEIVLNEATKRKSSAAVGFNNQDERQLGDDAKGLDARMPKRAFLYSKSLLGESMDSGAVADFLDKGHPYDFVVNEESGGISVRHDMLKSGGVSTFMAEELAAFVLTYAKKISEAHAESAIKDCVITVPPFWLHTQREALLNAASIVGLNVLALVHDHTAVAFKWGFDKEPEFKEEPKNVVFYDMGATSLKVSLATFSTTVGKKNKTTGNLVMRAVAWDESLGGREFDHRLINYIARKFNTEKLKGKGDVRENARAMGKLRKECEKIKEVLSANTEIPVGIESLYEEMDFFTTVKRSEFEEISADLFARIPPVLERLMTDANLTIDDVHYVEQIGGATRIHRVKQTAVEFFKRQQLDGGLNGDEAHALGATLYAAKLSTSFRLREFGITDTFLYSIGVKMGSDVVVDEEAEEGGSKKKDKEMLFKKGCKFPLKRLMTLSKSEDFSLTLHYKNPESLPAGVSTAILAYNITGVKEGLKSLEGNKLTSKPKVSLTFSLNVNGLVELSKAELAVEMLEIYNDTIMVPANTTTNTTNVTASASSGSDTANNGSAGGNGSNTTSAKKPKMHRQTVEKTRKRMHHVPLTRNSAYLGELVPITQEAIQDAIEKNTELLRQDKIRSDNAQAKNALESYIIETRGSLMNLDDIEKVSPQEVRIELCSSLEAAEEWLYEEGMELAAAEYKKKLKEVSVAPSKILFRLEEMAARPKAVEQAKSALNWTTTLVASWAEERPEISEAERNTTMELCANFTAWLTPLLEKQQTTPLTEEPVFTSSEVSLKLAPVEKEVRKLIKKPKPKPAKVKRNKTNSTNSTNSSADSSKQDNSEEPNDNRVPDEKKDEL